MDKKSAKEILLKHNDALKTLLDSDGMGDIKVDADKALKVAEEGTKEFQKTLLEKFREFPIVEKVTSLGTAGTVAVSTAAVTQTELAVDMTEVFVAEIAEDVVEERFEVPQFFEMVVDFHSLNDWGQQVIAEKVAEAQTLVSEPQPISIDTHENEDTKEASSVSSTDVSSDKPVDEQESKELQTEEEVESKEEDKDSSKQKEPQEEEEIEEEEEASTEDAIDNDEPVKTPFEPLEDDIRPNSIVVSPSS